MSNRNLVIVRAGDRSLHPQWLATGGERNWDLVIHYSGSKPHRYPVSGEGVVRIDGSEPKWSGLYGLLDRTYAAWQTYQYLWFPDDDLIAGCDDINRMFDLIAGLDLQLVQPARSWQGRVEQPLTGHNRNFALRYSSFVDTAAPVFSRRFLERVVPSFQESRTGAGLGHLWPTFLDNSAKECAILDCVQVVHTGATGGGADAAAPAGGTRETEARELLRQHGIPAPIELSYGALDAEGQLSTLFGDSGEAFVFRLCDGYRDCGGTGSPAVEPLFAAHAQARRDFLQTRTQAVPAAAPAARAAQRVAAKFTPKTLPPSGLDPVEPASRELVLKD